MPEQEQIARAADLIDDELQARGVFGVGRSECLKIARQLYDIWMRPGGPQRHIPAGEVAQRFRQRYEQAVIDAGCRSDG